MSELVIPVDIEKSVIGIFLNAMIVDAFGMGMYTVVYIGTMYIYFTRSASKRYIVPTTITVLFLCNLVETGVQWYGLKLAFVDKGDVRGSVLAALLDSPSWVYVAVDISAYTGFVLADALLIWRCFFVWNRSIRVISISLFLLITEIALFLVLIVFRFIFGALAPTAAKANAFSDLIFAALIATFATTSITTILIAYRIYSTAKQGTSRRRFRHIINIVVLSGAVYALVMLVSAIAPVLPADRNIRNTWAIALNYYTTALVGVVPGMSATILVARVSMLPTNTTFPSTSVHLSGLQFHARSTQQTNILEGTEATHSVVVVGNMNEEGLPVESKVQ